MSKIQEDTAEAVHYGKQAVGAAKEVATAAIDSASRKAAEVAEKVKEVGNKAAGYVQDKYEHLSETAHDAYSHAKETACDWENSFENYVKRRPLQSLLIAAGAGALLALLLRRRD